MLKGCLIAVMTLMFMRGAVVQAVVIYENGAMVNIGVFSDLHSLQVIANDFRLRAGLNVITAVHWTGGYAPDTPTAPDNFTLAIFADVGGVPAFTPLVALAIGAPGRTDTGIDLFSEDLFAYAVNVPPITLTPDTPFWLSIVNDTSANRTTDWFWGSQFFPTGGGLAAHRSSPSFPWLVGSGFEQDFTLTGPAGIPEPSTLVLLSTGLVGLLGYRYHRRRRVRAFLLATR